MDILAEKISLMEWLAGIEDKEVISQLKAVMKINQQSTSNSLSSEEREAIARGLKSIKEGRIHSHDSVMESLKTTFPTLFE